MDRQAPKTEKFETLNREENALLTAVGEVQNDVNLWTKATVHDKTPEGGIRESRKTCREEMTGTTHIVDMLAQKTSFGDMLNTQNTNWAETEHQTTFEEFKTFKADKGMSLTPEGDNTVEASAGEHRTSHRNGNVAVNRDNGVHSTPKWYLISMHGPCNKSPMSLTTDVGDNNRLKTSKRDIEYGRKAQKTEKWNFVRWNEQTKL